MSNIDKSVAVAREHAAPSLEPWLLMCLLALVPGVLIVILPRARLIPLLMPIVGSMVALLAIGLAMLWRTERARRREEKERELRSAPDGADRLTLLRREA